MPKRPRILILGGGFGGVSVVKALRAQGAGPSAAEVTLISESANFLFTPLLHEVATGAIGFENLILPLRSLVGRGLSAFYNERVLRVDLTAKIVTTKERTLEFDYLVLALGAQSCTFGVKGADEFALPLKSLNDARAIRDRLVWSLEKASATDKADARRALLRFVVVGGGALGTELAPEVSEFLDDWAPLYPKLQRQQMEVHLVHGGKALVEQFGPGFNIEAQAVFRRKKIKTHFESRVIQVTPENLVLSTGETIDACTTIWTAGVEPVTFDLGATDCRVKGRFVVRPTLQIKELDYVFALGDIAFYEDQDGRGLPGTAQVATQQGRMVATNLRRLVKGKKLQNFKYRHHGFTLSLGQLKAIIKAFGLEVRGPIGWAIYRGIYLAKLFSAEGRIRVLFDWFLDVFFRRRGKEA